MTVYISGPITGIKNYREVFQEAQDSVEGLGFKTVSPITIDILKEKSFSWSDAMKICIALMEKCDAVLFIDGWEMSVGARIEHSWAKRIGLPAYNGIEELKSYAESL